MEIRVYTMFGVYGNMKLISITKNGIHMGGGILNVQFLINNTVFL